MRVPSTPIAPRRLVLAGVLAVCLAAPSGAGASPRLTLVAPSAAAQPSRTLRVAGQLANTRRDTVFAVRVESASVAGTVLLSPLPLSFKSIAPGATAIVGLRFRSGKALPGRRLALVMRGTYRLRRDPQRQRPFAVRGALRVPPRAPGESAVGVATAPALRVEGGQFKPVPPRFDDEHVNGSRWTVPTGPARRGKRTRSTTGLERAPRTSQAGSVIFRTNAGLGVNGSTILEPTGGVNAGGVVFAAGNWLAAYSTNGGASFSQINPTSIFPNDAIGFCCDQVIQYVASIDRFIWLLQGTNGYRLASASPATLASSGGTAWTYWNLPSTLFGQPAGTGLDYPDVSVGTNSLYLSWDNGFGGCPTGCQAGLQVSRIGLAAIQSSSTIGIAYTHPQHSAVAWGSHLVQDTGDEIFWAGHTSNSQMRVFSLHEGSNTYFWRDIGVSSWANNALSSTTPDSRNWVAGSGGFPGNAVIGGTRSANHVWFAWDAGTNASFAQPHIEMVDLDRGNNFARNQQVQIWNSGFAFAYPSLATHPCTGEVAMSLETGGGGKRFENHAVGFWGDFLVYLTTNSTVGTTRFGDYVTIRNAPVTRLDPGNLFAAFGYGLLTATPPATGSRTDMRYVLFGRPPASCKGG
jgi:hypothetical protein